MNLKALVTGLLFAAGFGMVVNAQGKYGETEQDSLECLKNLSLYTEYYKQEAYDDAVKPLLKAMNICPASSKNLYIRGANIFTSKLQEAKKAGNDELQKSYLDTLMLLYDNRMEHFGQRGYVLGRKGTDLLRYGTVENYEDGYKLLRESFELTGDKTQAGILAAMYQSAYFLYAKNILEKEKLIDLYLEIKDVISKNKDGKSGESYRSAGEKVDEILGKAATCTDLVEIFEPEFKESPEDADMLETVVNLFTELDCTNEALYLKVSMKLDELRPSADSKYAIGVALIKEQRYEEAVDYLTEAAEMSKDKETKLSAYIYAGKAVLQLKRYASAKSMALKALETDPGYAEAYMLIGDAYFYGSKTVGDNDCEKAGGYWAAIPKYQKAKSLDGGLGEKADRKIGSVRAQLPEKKTCFFENISDGETYQVGGWINETVTVETR